MPLFDILNLNMVKVEKKFLVESLDSVLDKLQQLGAKASPGVSSHHTYADTEGPEIVKMVESGGNIWVHEMADRGGTFELVKTTPVDSKEAGLELLNLLKPTNIQTLKIDYINYYLENATIGLYTLNDSIYSVIIYSDPNYHDKLAKKLGLNNVETIEVPFNHLLSSQK